MFNSDAAIYSGDNVGNSGAPLPVIGGQMNAVIPAHGFVVFERVSSRLTPTVDHARCEDAVAGNLHRPRRRYSGVLL